MKNRAIVLRVLASLALLSGSALATAATLTDQLMAELLQKHLPARLYQKNNNAWPGGSYNLQVFKHGKPEISSQAEKIHIQMPLRITLAGNAASDLLGIKLDCRSSFITIGEITFTPAAADGATTQPKAAKEGTVKQAAGKDTALKSSLHLPIPAVMADCDRLQLSIEAYLKAFVAQNKPGWERQLDQEVNAWLAQ